MGKVTTNKGEKKFTEVNRIKKGNHSMNPGKYFSNEI